MNFSDLQHLRKTNLNRFIANCLNKSQVLGFVEARSKGTQLRELLEVPYQQNHDITDDEARRIETILNLPRMFLDSKNEAIHDILNQKHLGVFSSNYNFEHSKLLGWKHLVETPHSLDSADIYCHVLDDAGFPDVLPFHSIVVVSPVSNFTGDGFYVNWRNQDECLSLRRLVRSDSAPATLFSYHSWNAKPETLTLTLSSHDFEYYGKVLEVLPRNGMFQAVCQSLVNELIR
jgi:hypothetical protein